MISYCVRHGVDTDAVRFCFWSCRTAYKRSVIDCRRVLYGVIGLVLIAIYYTTQMKLDRERHTTLLLLEEIACIKADGAIADVPVHARAVAEALTGWKYEQCW